VGIWNSFLGGNLNIAYNLQFAILPLIREMKSFNFPQGFKEALSIRGIEIGPPKMNYPGETLNKLSDLKERLYLDMKSLLERYFGVTSPVYNGRDMEAKLAYPQCDKNTMLEKKYSDCALCGMCTANDKDISKQYINGDINLKEKDLRELIENTVKKILNEGERFK